MDPLLILAIWIGYWGVNIFIAWWNNVIRLNRIKAGNKTEINHPLWGAFYCGLCAIPFIWIHSWWQVLSLVALHGSVFPVAWNIMQGNNTPAFFLSKTTTALFDRFQLWLGFTSSEFFNLMCLAVSLVAGALEIVLK